MNKVTNFCRCDNQQRLNGSGCSICQPIKIDCSWNDDAWWYIKNGKKVQFRPDEALYLYEQLGMYCNWKPAG